MNLDSDQLLVANNPEGARVVLAGPGAGKSSTMVEMIRALLTSGIPASDIRAVTFSKEMALALEKKLGVKGVVSTFHSLGYLISSETTRTPVEPERQHRLMCNLTRKWGVDYKVLGNFIGRLRRENISPEQAAESGEYSYGACTAYAEYERVRLQEGWMDFDAMLRDSVDLLESNPHARARQQVKYLLVDEAQDTDDLSFRLLQILTEKHGNITVVGDPGQAIYSFRGAKPENITNFQQWFPTGRNYFLGRNYRSTRRIVKFIRENAPRDTPKELLERMTAARKEEGRAVGLKMYWNEDCEAESTLKLAITDPLNSIILARTNRMVGLLERVCNRNNVRYHLLGKTGFWKQNEIRKAIEALKVYPNLSTEQAMGMVMPKLESKYAVDDRTERDNDALENLQVLRTISKEHKTAKDFCVYANKMMHRRNDPKGVTISTVHQAKGGEWKNVYVIGVKAKGFPHHGGDPPEEERIYFVAISRPIDYLRLSFSGTPSPYLRRYLTEEILDKLTATAHEVEKLETQTKLDFCTKTA